MNIFVTPKRNINCFAVIVPICNNTGLKIIHNVNTMERLAVLAVLAFISRNTGAVIVI